MNSDSESEGSSSNSSIGDNDVSREISVHSDVSEFDESSCIGENNSSDSELTENLQECADANTHKTLNNKGWEGWENSTAGLRK